MQEKLVIAVQFQESLPPVIKSFPESADVIGRGTCLLTVVNQTENPAEPVGLTPGCD